MVDARQAHLSSVVSILESVRLTNPLVLHLTNIVVTNDQANVALAIGASPIMSLAEEEQEDLAPHLNSLLVNIGTISSPQLETMLTAGRHANKLNTPIVLDPVGVGASSFRGKSVKSLLEAWRPSVITGNAAEIRHLAGLGRVKSHGVDSKGDVGDAAELVRSLARKEDCVVVLHGAMDWLSDGQTVVKLSNGSPRLAEITGTGCMAGTIIASCCGAVASTFESGLSRQLVLQQYLDAAIAGVSAVCIAGELADERTKGLGSVSFKVAWIDQLGNLSETELLKRVRIDFVQA